MWSQITDKEDIIKILDIFDEFHDSCIKEIKYVSGVSVDDNLCMHTDKDSMEILFESQGAKYKSLSIKFIDISAFCINKKEGYIHEIYDISLFMDSGHIYWADSEEFSLGDKSSYCGSWICSRKAMWSVTGGRLV